MIRRRKIGIFGGSFDPLHFGHINLALELKEKGDLDEVWLVPSLISPLKLHSTPVAAAHRLEMARLGVCQIPGFFCSDIELQRPAPSYTVDTIRSFLKENPNDSFYLLLGEDSVAHFPLWKEPLTIVRSVSLLIGSRPDTEIIAQCDHLGIEGELAGAIHRGLIASKQMQISSSCIRDRLKQGKYCGHLLPGKILDYICENQLYCTSSS